MFLRVTSGRDFLFWAYKSSSNLFPAHLLNPDLFNSHFIDSLPSSSCAPSLIQEYLDSAPVTSNSFQFSPITPATLYSIMKSIKLTSAGPHDLSGPMILLCLPHCIDPLLSIINKCLSTGNFPSAWKQLVVFPIPKSQNPSSLSSFRPITIPPFLSKILERVWFHQLSVFLQSTNAIPTFQSGFRRYHSTTTSLLHISDSVLKSYDAGSLSALVGLDFSKAFDTVNLSLPASPCQTTILWPILFCDRIFPFFPYRSYSESFYSWSFA